MTLLDAHAVIAFLLDEAAAEAVEAHLRSNDDRARMSAVNLAEVLDRLIRVAGQPEQQVVERVEWLVSGGMEVVPADDSTGRLAGLLRARHYHHREAAVSVADCITLATAIGLRQRLATADPALAAVARKTGVDLVPLPDARGRTP